MAYKHCGLHAGTRRGPALKGLQPVRKISELGGQRRRPSLSLCVQSLMLINLFCPPLEYRVKEWFRDLWLLEEAPSARVHPVLFLQCHQSRGDPQWGDPSVGRSGAIHLQVSPQRLPALPENGAPPRPVDWAPVSSHGHPQWAAREVQVLTASVWSAADGGHTAVNEWLCGWASPSLLCLEVHLLLPELEIMVTKPGRAASSPYLFKVAPWFSVGFPGGSVGKESACNWRDVGEHEFNPRLRNIPWRRTWQPTPVFLPGESHGQRSLAGYCPWGDKELDTTEATKHTGTWFSIVTFRVFPLFSPHIPSLTPVPRIHC